MHFDNLDNLFAQIVGRKTFVLTPPEEGISLVHGRCFLDTHMNAAAVAKD